MSPVEDIISSLLSAGGVPDSIVGRILIESPDNGLREIAALDVNEPCENDVYGLISSNVQSTTKRRRLTSSFPPLELDMLSDSFFAWLKTLSECRCRPVRSAASLASFFVVEQVIKKFKVVTGPAEIFCGKVCREILIPRCRDTCDVIRQMGAEYIGRWYRLRPVKEALSEAISDLMFDDESSVRVEMIKALKTQDQFKVDPDLGRVLIKAFLVRCEEVHEDHQPSARRKEIVLHAELLKQVFFRAQSNLLIDSLDQEVEFLYQVLWDRQVPLEARTSIAEIVSKHVMGEDILCSRNTSIEEDKVYDIIEAFINEYNPWSGNDLRRFHHVGVWEAFISSYHFNYRKDETPHNLQSFMRLAVCRINIDLIEVISRQVELHRLTSFTFLGAENIFRDQRLLFDIRLIDSVHRLAKSTTPSCFLNISPELIANSLSALVTSSKCSYSLKYLAYRLWDTLAASNHALALATIICDEKNLENVHAFEAAVPRLVVDLPHVRDLLHFINSGLNEMISLPTLVCALDIALMRFLTLQHKQQVPACSVLQLKAELESTFQSVILRGGDSRFKLLSSFCKYRLKALENPNITLENKHKRLVEIRDTRHLWDGVPASTYIISSLIEQESIDASILAYME